ncbi:hypothetical protein H0Z60_00820 [Ectothiorhodospiraceae bacterium WFHF3C12]|nr:hypothetical protein [Ectothiorhodospiraceae bacterium WFHF3C12]
MDHRSLILRMATAGLVAGAMFAGTAIAQADKQSGGDAPAAESQAQQNSGPSRQELMQTQRKLQNLQKELGQLRQQALEENPELAEERENLRDLLISTMQDNGHSPEKDQARMKEIQSKLQSGDVEQGEKQQLVQEMRKHQRSLVQGQREAFQSKEVQEKAKQFEENLVAAMKETDPEAESLIQEFNQTQQQMQQQMRQMQGARQQGNR